MASRARQRLLSRGRRTRPARSTSCKPHVAPLLRSSPSAFRRGEACTAEVLGWNQSSRIFSSNLSEPSLRVIGARTLRLLDFERLGIPRTAPGATVCMSVGVGPPPLQFSYTLHVQYEYLLCARLKANTVGSRGSTRNALCFALLCFVPLLLRERSASKRGEAMRCDMKRDETLAYHKHSRTVFLCDRAGGLRVHTAFSRAAAGPDGTRNSLHTNEYVFEYIHYSRGAIPSRDVLVCIVQYYSTAVFCFAGA